MDLISFPVCINTLYLKSPNLTVYYPNVSGLANLKTEQIINQTILENVYSLIQKQGYYDNPRTEVLGHYELKTNERDILSLSLINYAFAGGAHGMTYNISLTFNVKTGKVYRLQDLFKENSDYVKRLSDIIKRQIKERDIFTLDEFKSIKPNQDFYIADKALVIYFQLYEITPYYYGFPYFPISVYEIRDIIDEEGPLGKMMY